MSRAPVERAFPVAVPIADPGMSLRDYFAAQALIGLLAQTEGENGDQSPVWPCHENAPVAAAAYDIADAMLAARGGS